MPAVRARLGEWDTCFVVDEDSVVLGRLGRSALRSEDDVAAAAAMRDGPGTIRPSARLVKAVEWMRKREVQSAPVTTSDGRLYGLLLLADAEAAVG
jgi:Mg/Co/Ni transporter MgtE